MISGARLSPGRLAIDYVAKLGGVREASVVGTRLLTCPVHAALANGMLAHADETDDSHAPSRNHPGCAVIPAALAVGESVHAGGEAAHSERSFWATMSPRVSIMRSALTHLPRPRGLP